ncbi:MAG: N-acetylmannosaminyltransferase [Bryobacterales bacterium]|jgi:N-acetylglucosaminyldiphosphoundecaprenol N-acetyl-beta-D-mannosaminyltransferase|nr:N-acetylmannosaminyltransferase [Bryobacterales bacterium]
MAESVHNSLSILGIPVNIFDSFDDVVQWIADRITSRQPTFCVAINPEKVCRAEHDPRLSQVLHAAHLRICDGVGISLASRLLYRKRLARCTGVDLFLKLLHLSEQRRWKVFLLGASPESNEAACRVLEQNFPDLRIAGSQHGYFEGAAEVVQKINDSGADLLFVAMGSPRQEFWISEHMPRLNTCFCMGVGGSLDVVSGATQRAPYLWRRTGTEWLFRLLVQPSRIRRQSALLVFTFDVLKAMARHSSVPVAR